MIPIHWLLLIISFTGSTLPDKITYKWFDSEEQCEYAFKNTPIHWYDGSLEHVCIPFGDQSK